MKTITIQKLKGRGGAIYEFERGSALGLDYMKMENYTIIQEYEIPAPKKKVKKTSECWMNVYKDFNTVFFSKNEADEDGASDRIACVKLTGEYEVEE